MGHIVSEEGIHTDSAKTMAVNNWPTPQNLGDLRSFMGLCSYNRQYLPDFATLAKPFVRLTEKNTAFRWAEAEDWALSTLKEKLTMALRI